MSYIFRIILPIYCILRIWKNASIRITLYILLSFIELFGTRNVQTFPQPIQYLLVHVFAKPIVNHKDEHDLLTSNLVVCKLMPNSQQDVSSCETFLEKPVFWKVAFCRCNTITCGMYTWNFNWYLILDDNEIQY